MHDDHALLQDHGIPVPRAPIPLAVEDFLATMPAAYHDRFSEADARTHAGIVLRRQGASIHLEQCGDAGLLCIVTDHLPGVMRTIAAVLAAHSLNILDKTMYCRTPLRGWSEAVSFYRVAASSEGPQLDEALVASIRETIINVQKGKVDINSLSHRTSPTWRPPPPPLEAIPEPEPSSVNFDRLSQIQMAEPPPAPPLTRYSKVPQAAE
jgi:hypothetical protein